MEKLKKSERPPRKRMMMAESREEEDTDYVRTLNA
jgi:hypothetical protein